jgi:uncharacterized protein GlcG (DUF336 family)
LRVAIAAEEITMRTRALISLTASLATAGALAFAMAAPGHAQQAPPSPDSAGNANGPPPRPLPPEPRGPRPPDVVARGPSIELALEAARAIVASCKGYHVSVSVLDAAGTPKLYYVPDGTAGHHAYTGFRKANTALAFGMPSGQVAAAVKGDPALAAKYAADSANYVTWAGGVLIRVGNEVIGAIGVSGAEPSEKDEACAIDGLNKIRSKLK